jgi:choice-of-anchor B domain-containing protein
MLKTITCLSFILFLARVSPGQNIQLRAHVPYSPVNLANIGGYVDSSGNEYALVGTTAGLSIVDVTIPSSPVQKFMVPGTTSIWREVKTWLNYAYVTNENGGGLQIINLGYLPDSVQVKQWNGDAAINGSLQTIHALHIDDGFVYLFGCGTGSVKLFNGAGIICDLNADPWNPHFLGHTTDFGFQSASYIHDGYVSHDTLWAGHIYAGQFRAWDCTNKAAPVLLASKSTPGQFTHNTWLSDDHSTLFTTDETSGSYLTAYDVRNVSNISELSRFQTAPGSNSMVHNTHILNDYAVTSWYGEGVVITDVSRPQNPIEVGKYDTYPGSSTGSNGCWGAYPFLPSGTLLASDIENGLYVLTPTYIRACYLEGVITDSVTGTLLQGVTVSIVSSGDTVISEIDGEYRTGTAVAGTYDVTFSKNGYHPKTISGVSLSNGILTNLNVQLSAFQNFSYSGVIADSASGAPLAFADIWLTNDMFSFKTKTDSNGVFNFPIFYDGVYDLKAGKWGYRTICTTDTIPLNAPADTLRLPMGYYDDFTFDFGWQISGSSLNLWERAIPVLTTYFGMPCNPGVDDSTDCSDYCFVTDNGGGSANANDVDNGNTFITSPVFDLTSYVNPVLQYSRWFFNDGTIPNDTMKVLLTDGLTSATVETMCPVTCSPGNGTWVRFSVPVSLVMSPSSTMRLIVYIADDINNHTLEGGFDHFMILGDILTSADDKYKDDVLSVFPNPAAGSFTIRYNNLPQTAILDITDVCGRLVESHTPGAVSGSIQAGSNLRPGIYFTGMRGGNKAVKIIKTD